MKFKVQTVVCNFCKSPDYTELWEKHGFHYVRCNKCALIYLNPQICEDDIDAIYKIGYNNKHETKLSDSDYSKYEKVLKILESNRKTNNMLDIGCFDGYFLKAAKQRYWKVFGTEITENAVEHARNLTDGDIRLGRLSKLNYEDNFFDVVNMSDVIEHVDNPSNDLEIIFKIIRQGGILRIETPNFNCIPRIILGAKWNVFFPWHMHYFTVTSLSKILQKYGFEITKVYTINLGSFSTFDPLENFSQSGKIANDSGLSIKRKIKKARSIVLTFRKVKEIVDLFFKVLSFMKIYVGATIIIYATKK